MIGKWVGHYGNREVGEVIMVIGKWVGSLW